MQIINYPGHAPDSRPLGPAPLTPALRRGPFLQTSGQVGIDPNTAQIVGPDFDAQAHQAFRNIRALVENGGLSMADVIKVTVFLTRAEDFPALNAIYSEYFSAPYPCRSTLIVALQPASLLIEVEALAVDPVAGGATA